MSEAKLILLTNDDGIHSPGLWAAASELMALGEVMVVAPLHQNTSIGRSMPASSTGRIHIESLTMHGRDWQGYAVDGTPAQAVQHALLEVLPRTPDLAVSGINYGENVGTGVTISGTVGAAMEAATFHVPALAVSLETDPRYHLTHSDEVDFSAAAAFTRRFAELLLCWPHPADVDVLKVEVPAEATPHTPWRVTRLSRERYYHPKKAERPTLAETGPIGYYQSVDATRLEPDSDVRALLDHVVSVTPLSLDMTSRVDLISLARELSQNGLGHPYIQRRT
jgi:5'-nucleotidase